MILQEVEPSTGLPKVQETRLAAVADPVRRGCTCPQFECRWRELPRDPWQKILHELPPGWTPQYQTFVDGSAHSVLCWKCGRAIKGYLPKLTRFGKPIEVDGKPAVHLALYDHYRAKPVVVYLPTLNETYRFDALHCADCTIGIEDGQALVAIWLAGLLEGYREGTRLAERLKMPMRHTPDQVATYLARWSKAEPREVLHRAPDSKQPGWRS